MSDAIEERTAVGLGRFVSSPDTFLVEELPAYEPAGEGSHTYLWIEKRDLTTPEALRRLARALGVPERDLGYAGMKDRHAVTRQWISVPNVEPERAQTVELVGLKVLDARRHGNKLRVGHVRGNRFEAVISGVPDGGAARLSEALGRLVRQGMPNRYGEQRFGARGDNFEVGLALLRGTQRERDHRRRRLLLSAVQSTVFNRTLELRASAGSLARVLGGDVLQRRASGGSFVSTDPAVDQPRVDAGELAITGPMPGSKVIEPPAGSEASAVEAEAVAACGLAPEELAGVGRDLPGSRRPLLAQVTCEEPAVTDLGDGKVRVRFSLPAGSYATVLLAELPVRMG